MSVSDNNKNRGAHGDSSSMLGWLRPSSENPPALAVGSVKLYNFGTKPYHVHAGDKIAQLIIMPYLTPELELVDDLDDTERGDNGFGSTGV